MQINIKTSAANQSIVSNLTLKLPGGAKENIIARIALGFSLASGKRFQQNEFNTYDSQGKEAVSTCKCTNDCKVKKYFHKSIQMDNENSIFLSGDDLFCL